MKKLLAALWAGPSFILAYGVSAGGHAFAAPAPVVMENSATFTMTSSENGRTYKIFISWPDEAPPKEGYPVIYMTDANARFGTMTETARAWGRERRSPNDSAMVVGVGYPEEENPGRERSLDLTLALGDSETPEGFGGASAFLKFILQELKPHIENNYSIDVSRQALFGHSFGGLFALHTLFNQPDAFQTYLISSPSIWWGERFIMEVLPRLTPKLETTGATPRVLLTVGEFEQVDGPGPVPLAGRPQLPGVVDRTQVDDAREMWARLASTPGVFARYVLFTDEAHGTVPPASMSRSVSFFFDPETPAPDRAPSPTDRAGKLRANVPTADEYAAMTSEERYRLRLAVRSWPEDESQRFLAQLKYNLEAGLWYDEQHALHMEYNAMDERYGTGPVN